MPLTLDDRSRGWLALADPDQLDQVLWAILDNAVGYGRRSAIQATVTVDLSANTVGETGSGDVSYSGVETVNVGTAGGALTVSGTAGHDAIVVTPVATGVGNFTAHSSGAVVSQSPLVNYTGVGAAAKRHASYLSHSAFHPC